MQGTKKYGDLLVLCELAFCKIEKFNLPHLKNY